MFGDEYFIIQKLERDGLSFLHVVETVTKKKLKRGAY
jgi:hypothetical protein